MDILNNPDNLRILSNVLKTNVAACTSIGSFFTPQIALVYIDMLGLYRAVSSIISDSVAKEGALSSLLWPASCAHANFRANRYEDPESSPLTDCQEGNSPTSRNIYQES